MKIICLGSLNMDYVYKVERFVKAGETVASLAMDRHYGGKGLNQAIALKRAGCNVSMAGMVGADGNALLEYLAENNVDTSYVQICSNVPTGHAIIQVEPNGQNCIIIAGGANQCIDEAYIDRVYSGFSPHDVVLLQNEISCLEYAIYKAHELGLRVALNPSPITPELIACAELRHISWFLLNEIEGEMLTGQSQPEDICRIMREQYPNACIILTLGKEGCLYYDGQTVIRHGIYNVRAVDTTAAGDTFTGYFLAGITEGLEAKETLSLASKAAALAVSAAGAAESIPMRHEVEKAE